MPQLTELVPPWRDEVKSDPEASGLSFNEDLGFESLSLRKHNFLSCRLDYLNKALFERFIDIINLRLIH
jgi:hypothetical protein